MTMKDESISRVYEDWSKTLEKSSSVTASFLNESTGDSKGLSNKKETAINECPVETTEQKRRRRFSLETSNDLLFWGFHLLVVGISLGIMWVKFDAMNNALGELLKAQRAELDIARGEIEKADQAYEAARRAEQQRSIDVRAAQKTLTDLVTQVHDNQASIKDNQDSIRRVVDAVGSTNQLILQASKETESAAKQSAHEAAIAAGSAGVAASRAAAAASSSGRTATVVATKVATQSDKLKVRAQQQDLARKQKQLSTTIRRVKTQGPSWWDKIVH